MRSNISRPINKDSNRKVGASGGLSKSPIPGLTQQFDFEDLLKEFKPAQLLKGSKSGPSLHSRNETDRNNHQQNTLDNTSINQDNNNNSRTANGPPKGIKLQQIQQFFKSVNSFQIPKLTKKQFKLFLQCFPKNFTNRDVTFLMSGKHELDPEQLFELLCINNVADFDPVEEAFRMLDVEGKGYITLDAFQETFCKLNDCTLTLLQSEILKDITDIDKDGKISLQDFRYILDELEQIKVEEDNANNGGGDEMLRSQTDLFRFK